MTTFECGGKLNESMKQVQIVPVNQKKGLGGGGGGGGE